jgi:transposase
MVEEVRLPTTRASFKRKFSNLQNCRVAMEVGSHSRWVSQQLKELGHDVLVANARKLSAIYHNPRKGDRADAETLARLARIDPELLSPIHLLRSPKAQVDLALLRSRDALIRSRTSLINHVRGTVKSSGARLPSYTANCFASKAIHAIPETLYPALLPVPDTIAVLTHQIRNYDKTIEQLCLDKYPEIKLLRKVSGVGPITALAYVLILEDPKRFAKSRDVGPAIGLVPRRDQSGDHDPQLRITKTGNSFLRRLLVSSAQYILGPFGPDCDLRYWGLNLA